jgi:hypothetical protein
MAFAPPAPSFSPPAHRPNVAFVSNTELDQRERAAEDAKAPPKPVLDALAATLRSRLQEAIDHRMRTGVTDALIRCKRQREGKYDPEVLAEIAQRGGTDLYFNITGTKCEAAEAWIKDVVAPMGERPWGLDPTPIPDLPEDAKENLLTRIVSEFEAQAAAGEVDGALIYDRTVELHDQAMQAQVAAAEERADRMADKIADQLAEGGWRDARNDFLNYLTTFKSALLRLEMRTSRRTKWQNGRIEIIEEMAPAIVADSPMDFYPGPGVREPNEGYLFVLGSMSKRDLAAMMDKPGWSGTAIREVLEAGAGNWLESMLVPGDSERQTLEYQNPLFGESVPDSNVQIAMHWGCVSGSEMQEWGIKAGRASDYNASDYYEVEAYLIGHWVVRAVRTPHPLHRRPIYVTSYKKSAGAIWGTAIAEAMRDCQLVTNGAMRHMLNNLSEAAVPRKTVDVAAMAEGYDWVSNWPGKVEQFNSKQIADGNRAIQPVVYWQAKAFTSEYMLVIDHAERKADDRTLIPRFAYGDANVGGAGDTASGLAMLMGAAAKGIKQIIANDDVDVTSRVIEDLYLWNMMHSDDESIKGDCRVVPRGAVAMLVREATDARRKEFADRLDASPTALEIVGTKGLRKLLETMEQRLDVPANSIVPTEEKLEAQVKAQLARQAEEMAARAQTTDYRLQTTGQREGLG